MDIRRITKAAREQGWEVTLTSKGHPRFVPPDPEKEICVFSGSPGDQAAIRNFLSELKRQGFVWPWTRKMRRKGGPK